METKGSSKLFQSVVLFTVAIIFAMVIFIVDVNVPAYIAIGAVYSIVILYSWLLPGAYTHLYTGIFCSILVIIGFINSPKSEIQNNLEGVNLIISLIVVWICVALVAAAKRGYIGLENLLEKLEDKVLERTKVLELKNKELEQFTYIASHDLQEPLRTVTSFTEFLAANYMHKIDNQGKQSIQYMLDATERMRNLVKGLLDYSRIGANTEKENVDCTLMLNEIKNDLATIISDHNAHIVINNLPRNLKAHGMELRQLFQNLLTNALKFRKDNSAPEIYVSSVKRKTYWDFSIKDNGIGIAKEHQKRIFKIFQRLHASSQYKGTGIGLAHCQKIVELHQGKIWVESEIGKGSTFYFRIPHS